MLHAVSLIGRVLAIVYMSECVQARVYFCVCLSIVHACMDTTRPHRCKDVSVRILLDFKY
jgi:hypothetical protein